MGKEEREREKDRKEKGKSPITKYFQWLLILFISCVSMLYSNKERHSQVLIVVAV